MASRSCGTVIAGVYFFSLTGFRHQKPSGDQRQGLMMMPTAPSANLVVGQAGFALAALNTLLDTMLRLGDPNKVRQFGVKRSVGQMVIRFDHVPIVAVLVTDHDEHLFVAFTSFIGASHHMPLNRLHDDMARSEKNVPLVN